MMISKRQASKSGFGLVETVVGTAIVTVVLFALAQVGQFTFRVVDEANFKLRGAFLAEEGIEAVRALRDAGWTGNIAPLPLCTNLYPAFSGGTWQLDVVPAPVEDPAFTRQVRIEAVSRDGATDDIAGTNCTGGDPDARRVTVDVIWMNRSRQASTTISTYLTNLFDN